MKHLLPGLFLLLTITSGAQNIQVVNNAINFGSTDELSPATADILIFNPGIYPIQVSDVDLFELYRSEPFFVNDTSFLLSPQDTQRINVSFLPQHNILHEMALVIKTESGFGHVAVELIGQGQYSKTYYNSTENKNGQSLKSALSTRVSLNYTSLGYTNARDNMYATIDNNGGSVECVYTGRTASFNTRAGANANSFNTEHTFPQGMFSQNEPMRSDIHHLFPTDVSANSQRGNDPFGMVSSASWSQGGSKSGGGKFEPRDVQKGATARAMMYFVLRYQDYNGFFQGQENVLYNWHYQYPPGTAETARNSAIFNLQNNRNPFVDYPQFMDRIPSLVTNASAPVVQDLYVSDDTIRLARKVGTHTFGFVLYNNGNADITLTNFSLSDTSLKFDQGMPTQLTLAPQQSKTLLISFNSASNYQGETLQFSTDISGRPNISVPISSGVFIGVNEHPLAKIEVFPNPTAGVVQVELDESEIKTAWLTALNGARERVEIRGNKLDLSAKAPGLYLLQVETDSGQFISKKLMRQ